jgi:anti-sigma factor RsiW
MRNVSEEMLIAYADGELDEVNRRRLERAIAENPDLAARLAQHERLRATLAGHYAPVAEQEVPDRFRALLEQGAASTDTTVVSLSDARERRAARWPGWASLTAIAASLVLGLALGRTLGSNDVPVGISGGKMVAQGRLASALDTQLASAGASGDLRMGLSFRAKGGNWCRSFEGADLSGVACRADDHWKLEQLVPGAGKQADYRQASSGDPRLTATIEALISGDPADAVSEKAARDGGWKR